MKDWDASACRDWRASTAEVVFVLAGLAALDSVSACEGGGPGTVRARAEPLRMAISQEADEKKYMFFSLVVSYSSNNNKIEEIKKIKLHAASSSLPCVCSSVCVTILKRAPSG